jgi:hypothetical protein
VGLRKADETAWRRAWGGTMTTANAHQASDMEQNVKG